MSSYQIDESHYGDEMSLGPSYLHSWISLTGKMTPFDKGFYELTIEIFGKFMCPTFDS